MRKVTNQTIIAILLSACAATSYPASAQSKNSLFQDEDCKRRPVKEIFYSNNGITAPRYHESIEKYLDTYKCDDFNENFELQVSTLLDFIIIGHTMSLAPVFPISTGGKSGRMSNLQNRLYQEAKSINQFIDWNRGTVTAEQIASIHEFACEAGAAIGDDKCILPHSMFLEIGAKLYPYERQELIQSFVSGIERFEK